jgi:hypothetical protein
VDCHGAGCFRWGDTSGKYTRSLASVADPEDNGAVYDELGVNLMYHQDRAHVAAGARVLRDRVGRVTPDPGGAGYVPGTRDMRAFGAPCLGADSVSQASLLPTPVHSG